MKVVTFGELLLRLASPGYTKLFQRDTLEATFCGAEANVAASLAYFGLEASFVTKLPDTDVGHAAARSLRSFGVDIREIRYGQGRMGLYYLEKGASQRPSKVIYDRAYSAIALARREEFDWDAIFEGATWFHWTGIDPALSQELGEICLLACQKAKQLGLTVSCDLNYRAKLWSGDAARRTMDRLMPYVDVCICNEEDAEKALGIVNESADVEAGDLQISGYVNTAKTIFSRYGCRIVATTLRKSWSASRNGWRGMLYDAASGQTCLSTSYDIQLVDRVGGGDSFAAGLIYGLITGMDDQRAIDFAAAASCLKQTMEGDFNRTTVADVENLLRSGGNGRVQR